MPERRTTEAQRVTWRRVWETEVMRNDVGLFLLDDLAAAEHELAEFQAMRDRVAALPEQFREAADAIEAALRGDQ